MRDHWFRGVRTVSTYAVLFPLVREHFQTQASKTPALQLLRNFPALHLSQIVLSELESMVELTEDEMVRSWLTALPKLIDYFLKSKIPIRAFGTTSKNPFLPFLRT
ncbi:uncharacterized protein LOC127750468 [Frankliniella occidentalis]|uniref:Uncharacterized protein LOC127750468 n=1 Tax=Frankliniella occidentalis TaxID=133901 RepID=A0A9C6X2U8_FRAOC|nr:uncharacterized protein LOC127750468 [Frankliniella occidentalis]